MSAVSIAEAWPAAGRPFTVTQLDRMPDDGRRYELLDGVLVVGPRPTTVHQVAAFRLAVLLGQVCPPDCQVVPEPAVQLSADTEFDPDIVVVRLEQVGGAKFTEPPPLLRRDCVDDAARHLTRWYRCAGQPSTGTITRPSSGISSSGPCPTAAHAVTASAASASTSGYPKPRASSRGGLPESGSGSAGSMPSASRSAPPRASAPVAAN